jgi:hypothetical protein
MEYFCTCMLLEMKTFLYHKKSPFKNTNQALDVFINNQLDNVKTVASTDDSFFAKYLTSEKVSI